MMDGGFAWTIPLIQASFGVLFLAAHRAGAGREARLWGIGFLLSALAFSVPALEPVLPIRLVAVSADTLFAVSFYLYAGAIHARFGGPPVRAARRTLLAVAIAAPAVGVFVLGSLEAELAASDLTCALQLAFALALIPRWPSRWVDRGLVVASWVVVIENLGRAASIPLTVADAVPSEFLDTDYSYLMYANAMLTGLAFSVLALVAATTDIISGFRRDAFADPLTGLLNRRGLETVAGIGRTDRSDAILSFDLDHFKQVNDAFGHDVGDRVLLAVADLVRSVVPVDASCARVGGEEFVVYLPGRSLAQAHGLASRLRAAMMRHDWPSVGIDWPQSASYGLSARIGGRDTLAEAMRSADLRLYEAKRAGRDVVRGYVRDPDQADEGSHAAALPCH